MHIIVCILKYAIIERIPTLLFSHSTQVTARIRPYYLTDRTFYGQSQAVNAVFV